MLDLVDIVIDSALFEFLQESVKVKVCMKSVMQILRFYLVGQNN